jgi:hypothetical protein
VFNERFLREAPSVLTELLPQFASMNQTLRVIDVPRATGGLILRVLMNAETEEAVGFLAVRRQGDIPAPRLPSSVPIDAPTPVPIPSSDEHWRWRLAMAERIAADVDPVRFGIKAMYVFGSTKNATAGPASDIDLLLHVEGTPEQSRSLQVWLEGWSACLAELNYLRTGYRTEGLLDVHLVTDDDVARQSSYAAKIGAITDAARPLKLRRG